ncbi:DMT family transporter [Streptococcaceae bacterium ESL0687]|nr:DMT family transporter [Streptococcaceae bacterium ESL0687]
MENKKWLGLLLVISGAILWGTSGPVAEYMFSTQNVSPLWVVCIRLSVAGALLLVNYRLANKESIFSIWSNPSFRRQLLLFSFFGMMPIQLLYFLAIKFSNASTATVLQFTSPVFIILYLAVKNHKLPSRFAVFSVALAMLGTFLLATGGNINSLSISLAGLLFGLSCGLVSAFYTLLPVQLLKHYDAKLVCGWGMLIGSLPLMPTLVLNHPQAIDHSFLAELVYIVIIGTMLAHLFYVTSLNYLKPEVTNVSGSFEPLTATLLSVMFLHLRLNLPEIIGIVLILIMAILQSLPQKYKGQGS